MTGRGPWKFWSTLACIVLLLMVDSTLAGRMLQQQASRQRRLQASSDDRAIPWHAPPVQSFLVSDGSWVDCIPIEGQISAHHPTLTDHIIQMMPTSPRRSSGLTRRSDLHPQLFAREHGGCPDGSIPVQRADPNRPLLKKTQSPVSIQAVDNAGTTREIHEYAVTGLPESPQSYSGAYSIFSVNGPDLGVVATDFSLSQVWVVDGYYNDSTLSTIEVGWQKYPDIHQNEDQPLAPHLFVYWTNNAYNQVNETGIHGCYNLECPGFVQVNNKWVIGGAMPSYTTLAQNAQAESEVEIEVLYDPTQFVWWLFLNNDPVGYWPSSIYEGGRLGGSAHQVQWGGEVFFLKDANTVAHSKTAMGSGAFPAAGYPVAAYQRNITFADATGNFFYPNPATLDGLDTKQVTDPLCYDISIQLGNFVNWGTYFFFGGSGGNNPGCVGKL
ncbi:hypothetical protein M758_1G229900 [Ceratodon purpureus]|uniref:Neprosin PEP catalytic domain-containing protein n=1 Tax=Ceratodon purpureus TaxID=3225 RepID=A0A8T0J6V3_CERPU|nr:hypothetical protein KC19_1G190000 [Ceratodon purpureus]KAG0631133.1 hypothetical protein M758_1G229900 [Ceratodon purpureus]